MNSTGLYSRIYALLTLFCIGYYVVSASDDSVYEIESHFHKKLFVVNVTCPDALGNSKENHTHDVNKRSLLPFDTLKNDVTLDEFHPVNEHFNDSDYVSKHHSSNQVYDLSVKGKQRGGGGSEALTRGDSDDSSDERDVAETAQEANSTRKTLLNINCESITLSSQFLNHSARHLKIKSSGSIEISPDWASNLTSITVLKIKSETGLDIPPNCSWVPSSAHSLDVAYTPLQTLSLHNCSHALRRVSLVGTSLSSLAVCLPPLVELDASWNILSDGGIDLNCGEHNLNVKNLKLHNNQLTTWSSCGWPALVYLELQNNKLESVDISSCSLDELLQLNLSNNKLQNAPNSYPLKLSSINLSHNEIKTINPFNRVIQDVDLSHNAVTVIGRGIFRSSSQLLSLDLSHNHITVIYGHDFVGLRALRYLDLSHNDLTHIRHEAFHPFPHILSINIQNNSIHQLHARLLANLPRNLQFHATNNPWRCSCHLLAALNKASTAYCKPDCPDQPRLSCYEGKSKVWAQDLLTQCIENINDLEGVHSVHLLPENNASDEDKSEEKMDSSGSGYYMVILITLLVFVIPLMGFGIRKLYFKRKNIKRWCNCLAPSSNGARGRWSAQMDRESDSETEF